MRMTFIVCLIVFFNNEQCRFVYELMETKMQVMGLQKEQKLIKGYIKHKY